MSDGQDTVTLFATELFVVPSWLPLELPTSSLAGATGTSEWLRCLSSKRAGMRSGGREGLVTLSTGSDSTRLPPAFLRLPLFFPSDTVGSVGCVLHLKASGSISEETMPMNSESAAGWGGDIRAGTQEEEATVSFLRSLRLKRESSVALLSSSSSLNEMDKASLVERGLRGR